MRSTDDVYIVRIQHSQAPKGIAKGKAWFPFALFCFLLQEQKEGLRGERCKPSPSGDSAPPLGDNILAPFTQNSLDLSPLLRYNYIEIFI